MALVQSRVQLHLLLFSASSFLAVLLHGADQMRSLSRVVNGDDVEVLVLPEVALVEGALHLVNRHLSLCQLLLHLLVLLLNLVEGG